MWLRSVCELTFISPYIHEVQASAGFYLVGEKSEDIRRSNGLYIFSSSASKLVNVGDAVSLTGTVAEYRPAASPNYLYLTEITNPTNIVTLSTGNAVVPVVLGKDRSPPTYELSALDKGADGFLSVPNNVTLIEAVNATLQPEKYGLDFWESLEGQLVTVPSPVALGFPNNFGDFWTHGDWPVTGKNQRGGLSLTFGAFLLAINTTFTSLTAMKGPNGVPDGNPEAIVIGSPLDGTKNPAVALGSRISDITGIVTYA